MPPLRLGVLGCGRVFERFHFPAIDRTPDVALAAAADPDPARLAWAAARSPRPTLAESLDGLLGRTPLDAVLILTPPATHADLAERATEAGLHVLVEKPMGLTVADGRRIVDAARTHGRRIQVGYARRFRAPYRALHAHLRGGGAAAVSTDFELAFATTEWGAHSAFLGDASRGGAPIEDVLSHQVDLLGWLLGAGPDAVRAELDGAGAVQADLRFGRLTARCRASHGTYAERLEVVLSDGRVLEATGSRLSSSRPSRSPWRRRRGLVLDRLALVRDKLLRRPNVSRTSFELQLRDFSAAVRGAPAAGAGAEDGLRVLNVLEACRRSSRQGGAWVAAD
jgi:predicted dehydrogenase